MEIKKVYKLGSCGDLTATILIARAGQEPADIGDGVVVTGRIILPAGGDGDLEKEIRFGGRVEVFHRALLSDWGWVFKGEKEGEKVRYRSLNFSSPRWSSAFKEAEEYLESEMGRLLAAIAAREAALQAAED
jgi:hypothetical protein